jgi:methionyl-tRNA formyltransferase
MRSLRCIRSPIVPQAVGRAVSASAVKQRAQSLGLIVEQPASLKSPEVQARLASYAPDVMVVVAYGLILPQAVLDIPRLGCLNIHGSLLPRWRGAAPIQRAVLAGDERTGVSIMLMDAGLDTGPELLRRELAIGPHETAGDMHDRLAPLGAAAIVDAVRGWAAGTLTPQPAARDGRDVRRQDQQGRSAHRLVAVRERDRRSGACVQPVADRGNETR